MSFSEVKKFIYELVKRYHPGAMVVWTKTKGVTPKPPYITLGYSNLNRSAFPLSDDEREHRYYNYDFIFEINLYTVGREVKAGNSNYYENTAVEDLEEFIRFLDSDGITEELAKKDVTIVMNPPIRDLSGVKNMASKLLGAIGIGFSIAGIANLAEAAADAEALKSQFSQVFGDLEQDASDKLDKIADDTGVTVIE